jgi:hypothetical protein
MWILIESPPLDLGGDAGNRLQDLLQVLGMASVHLLTADDRDARGFVAALTESVVDRGGLDAKRVEGGGLGGRDEGPRPRHHRRHGDH